MNNNPNRFTNEFELPSYNSGGAEEFSEIQKNPNNGGNFKAYYFDLSNSKDLLEYEDLMNKIYANRGKYSNFRREVSYFEKHKYVSIEFYTTDVAVSNKVKKAAQISNYDLIKDCVEELNAEEDEVL